MDAWFARSHTTVKLVRHIRENFEDQAYSDSNLEWRNRGIAASDENSWTYYSAPTGGQTPNLPCTVGGQNILFNVGPILIRQVVAPMLHFLIIILLWNPGSPGRTQLWSWCTTYGRILKTRHIWIPIWNRESVALLLWMKTPEPTIVPRPGGEPPISRSPVPLWCMYSMWCV